MLNEMVRMKMSDRLKAFLVKNSIEKEFILEHRSYRAVKGWKPTKEPITGFTVAFQWSETIEGHDYWSKFDDDFRKFKLEDKYYVSISEDNHTGTRIVFNGKVVISAYRVRGNTVNRTVLLNPKEKGYTQVNVREFKVSRMVREITFSEYKDLMKEVQLEADFICY